jgi:PEP-CTERM motif
MSKLFSLAGGAGFAALCLASSFSQANADALLFSSVTEAGGLYTYNYAVENNTSSTIWNVDILVENAALGPFVGQPIPPGYTAPSGWTMYGAVSGSIGGPPYNENGGFYEWYGPGANAIQPGATAFGFSVVSAFAPTLDNGLNDFFLYGSEGVVAFGNVVVPGGTFSAQFPSQTPLPESLPLFASGLGLIGMLAWWRKRRAPVAGAG